MILRTGVVESVSKGEGLFALSISRALTVQGKKGLNRTDISLLFTSALPLEHV